MLFPQYAIQQTLSLGLHALKSNNIEMAQYQLDKLYDMRKYYHSWSAEDRIRYDEAIIDLVYDINKSGKVEDIFYGHDNSEVQDEWVVVVFVVLVVTVLFGAIFDK